MKSIILATSSKQLEKLLKEFEAGQVEIVVVSRRIEPTELDKRFSRYAYGLLIPPMILLQNYLDYGIDQVYAERYFEHLKRPANYFFLNRIIYNLSHRETNMIIVCESDEAEFEYISLIGTAIEKMYQFKPVTYKKWKKGKCSKSLHDMDTLKAISEKVDGIFRAKLIDSGYDMPVTLLEFLPRARVALMTKKQRKLYYKHIERMDELEKLI